MHEVKIPSPVQQDKMVYKSIWMEENNTEYNVRCDICMDDDDGEGDEFVFCDGCNVAVHQSCYGREILQQMPGEN